MKSCAAIFWIMIWLSVLCLPPAQGLGAVKRYVQPSPEQIEAEILEMINRDRVLLGLTPLVPHPFLQEIARSHCGKMAAEDKLSHYFPGWPNPEQKLGQGNFCFLASAENVAHSQTPFAGFIHESLMASFRHKLNILDGRMVQVGIGVCQKGKDYFISEEFAAIIDCPDAGKAMVVIENDLCRWYKKKFNAMPVIAADARSMAKVSAQQYLINNPIFLGPVSDRKMRGINVCYNDLETILAELKKEVKNGGIQSFAVGAVWGRNPSFPGGAYSVCLLLFE